MAGQMDEWQAYKVLQVVDRAYTNTWMSLGSESWSAEYTERQTCHSCWALDCLVAVHEFLTSDPEVAVLVALATIPCEVVSLQKVTTESEKQRGNLCVKSRLKIIC